MNLVVITKRERYIYIISNQIRKFVTSAHALHAGDPSLWSGQESLGPAWVRGGATTPLSDVNEKNWGLGHHLPMFHGVKLCAETWHKTFDHANGLATTLYSGGGMCNLSEKRERRRLPKHQGVLSSTASFAKETRPLS